LVGGGVGVAHASFPPLLEAASHGWIVIRCRPLTPFTRSRRAGPPLSIREARPAACGP
jgi:hypothetical protein